MLRLGFMREALSYLTDPKVLRIWANIAYFLHFRYGEQLHKGYGRNYDTRNLQKPSKGWDLGHNKGTWGSRRSKGARLHFLAQGNGKYKRRGASMPPIFYFSIFIMSWIFKPGFASLKAEPVIFLSSLFFTRS